MPHQCASRPDKAGHDHGRARSGDEHGSGEAGLARPCGVASRETHPPNAGLVSVPPGRHSAAWWRTKHALDHRELTVGRLAQQLRNDDRIGLNANAVASWSARNRSHRCESANRRLARRPLRYASNLAVAGDGVSHQCVAHVDQHRYAESGANQHRQTSTERAAMGTATKVPAAVM